MPVKVNWYGELVAKRLHEQQVKAFTRAGIFLANKVKELLGVAGTEAGIHLLDIDKTKITRRTKKTREVTQEEFNRLAKPQQEARLAKVKAKVKKVKKSKLSVRDRIAAIQAAWDAKRRRRP